MNKPRKGMGMGFKAKARKHRSDAGEDDSEKKATKFDGEQPCGISGCENLAHKSVGGSSMYNYEAIDKLG
jgi:hypothetical protein